ncbi:HlyD family secretion protein [Paenibacillus sp. y28]|uniref:HlyD family secretion protein n=1 Tax=Paenibacillus sp. y28 TaxID=3129110 RepID=UPI003019FBBF
MKRSRIMLLVVLITLAAGGTLMALGGKDAVTQAAEVKSSILTAEQVNVSFQGVAGKVVQALVTEETQVKKGDPLMVLDMTDLDLQIAKSEADLALAQVKIRQTADAIQIAKDKLGNATRQAQLSVEQAQASRDLVLQGARDEDIAKQKLALAAAEDSYAHQLRLYNQMLNMEETYQNGGNKSAKDQRDAMEAAKNQLNTLENAKNQQQVAIDKMINGATVQEKQQAVLTAEKAQAGLEQALLGGEDIRNQEIGLETLNKQLEQQQIALQALRNQKERMTLKAPADGKVIKVTLKAGENVSAGTPVVLLQTGQVYYDIYVSEAQVHAFQAGGEVPTRIVSLDQQVPGTIKYVTAAPQFASLRMSRDKGLSDLNMFQVRVYVDADSSQPQLLPGMTAEVNVNEFISR